MPKARAIAQAATGFTLVELLVAVVLLAIGALGAVTMQRTAVKANQASYANEVATSLARQVLEATKNLDYIDGRLADTADSWTAVPGSLTMAGFPSFYQRAWQIQDNAPIAKDNDVRKLIRVRVSWNQAGQSRQIVLSSIKAWDGTLP